MTEGASADAKELVEKIAAEAEATADDPMPAGTVWTQPNKGKSVTVATRLAPADLAAIEALAARLDVPVAALVRGWILAGLRAHTGDTVHSALERLSADVARLRALVA